MKKLLLIDANSIIHRSFHALPPFTAPDGKPSGAIYGLSALLLKLWREEKPDYAAALFDRPEPTFRDEKYAEYKGKRAPTADELISQLIQAPDLFHAFGIQTFEKARYEADDLIATLAIKFTLQLVEGDKLVVKTFNKGVSDTTIYNEAAVIEKYGLPPNQLIDYKALVGDSSDNIKGVPGVGPKTALDLIKRFGTIENLYNHLDEDPKLKERLGPFQKDAELSHMLVTLETHAPIDIPPLEDLAPYEGLENPARYFEKMGFSTLIKRLHSPVVDMAAKPKPKGKTTPENTQASLF
jgi:DNA polymerase-1